VKKQINFSIEQVIDGPNEKHLNICEAEDSEALEITLKHDKTMISGSKVILGASTGIGGFN